MFAGKYASRNPAKHQGQQGLTGMYYLPFYCPVAYLSRRSWHYNRIIIDAKPLLSPLHPHWLSSSILKLL
jgi:hypothetical protein